MTNLEKHALLIAQTEQQKRDILARIVEALEAEIEANKQQALSKVPQSEKQQAEKNFMDNVLQDTHVFFLFTFIFKYEAGFYLCPT